MPFSPEQIFHKPRILWAAWAALVLGGIRKVSKTVAEDTPHRSSAALRVPLTDPNEAMLAGIYPYTGWTPLFGMLCDAFMHYLWGWNKYSDIHGPAARPDLNPHAKSYG